MSKAGLSYNAHREKRALKWIRYTTFDIRGMTNSKVLLGCCALLLFIVVEFFVMAVYAKDKVAYSSQVPLLPISSNASDIASAAAELHQPNADSAVAKNSLNGSYPYKISIPKIGAQAGVLGLGMNALGEMALPNNIYQTSWYKPGAAPGSRGSAVISGHYGAPYQRGIFRNLDQLKNGDSITVTKKSGEVYNYTVYKTMHVNDSNAPMQEIFNRQDGSYLNLITCFGNWDKNTYRYSDRLVVFAKLAK